MFSKKEDALILCILEGKGLKQTEKYDNIKKWYIEEKKAKIRRICMFWLLDCENNGRKEEINEPENRGN